MSNKRGGRGRDNDPPKNLRGLGHMEGNQPPAPATPQAPATSQPQATPQAQPPGQQVPVQTPYEMVPISTSENPQFAAVNEEFPTLSEAASDDSVTKKHHEIAAPDVIVRHSEGRDFYVCLSLSQ